MKKLLILFVSVIMLLNCLSSCDMTPAESTSESLNSSESTSGSLSSGEPTEEKKGFLIPEDETEVLRTVSADNADGLRMEITVHGYQSESLNKDFYVKNNEYFLVDVKVTNTSENSLWQWLPTYCRTLMGTPHNHEIKFDLSHGKYQLDSSSHGFACPNLIDVWKLEPGVTYEWHLKLAAGEVKNGIDDYDLPFDGESYRAGIVLYEEDIYSEGSCTFAGAFSFDYKLSEEKGLNTTSLSVPMEIDVVFVSAEAVKTQNP